MELLESPVRGYSWGSHTAIAEMQGRPAPTTAPEAELWMGAHPDSPSTLIRDGVSQRLDEVIAAEPQRLLGAALVERFGPRLPFMLKVLAADSPLSLQAHPDSVIAARRYAEEAALPAGERLYTDPYAKPELLVAVDDFDTLCGFRDPNQSADVLASLDIGALEPVIASLRIGSVEARLRTAVNTLLRWPERLREPVVTAVVAATRALGIDYATDLGERFAADMGVVVALLLNHVELGAGDAIWMPAGNIHAYLRGIGVELLASSDNVLRGGFTEKRVDVDELMRVVRFEVLPDPVVKPVVLAPGVLTWPVPAAEFALVRADITGEPVRLEAGGPRLVFCSGGALTVDDGVPLGLTSGQSAFGPAGTPISISGDGVVFIATAGA
jgi:mannose-6-phosphate isomerase